MLKEVRLHPHQIQALQQTHDKNRVAYYLDMGLGKTYVGSEKLKELGKDLNLLICQKSKISDWVEHFQDHYDYEVIDYTKPKNRHNIPSQKAIIIVNYETAWRRPELLKLKNFTLMLDESSYIKNEKSKRSKFVLKLKANNVILLSGTPVGGKYEELYSQCRLLGWDIKKQSFYDNYIITHTIEVNGFPMEIIRGYKNVKHLKRKLAEYGAIFMKSEEVLTLPSQVNIVENIKATPQYKRFVKDRIITIDDTTLVGDTSLTNMLYQRQLCGSYNQYKLERLSEILESTNGRILIFYNFTAECEAIQKVCKRLNKPISLVNGQCRDLSAYEQHDNAVVLIQYQAGSMGLNLQLSNHIIYYTLPLSSEHFEQSKKRIHRIGQSRTCFYYYLIVDNSIEGDIYKTLEKRQSYTNNLFTKGD